MLVHVLGLQRSGTNYLVELVRQNLSCETLTTGDRTICWKHALPTESGMHISHTGLTAGEAVLQKQDLLIILVAKHPFQWVSSVTTRGAQDIFLKRKELLVEGKPSISRLMQLYDAFYSGWLDLLAGQSAARHLFIRYEDALSNPDQTLRHIGALTGDLLPQSITLPAKVPFNRPFKESDRDRYQRFAHSLGPETTRETMAGWNAGLMKRMGYEQECAAGAGA